MRLRRLSPDPLLLLLLFCVASWPVGSSGADLICNEGKYHSCLCREDGGEWRGLIPHCYALLNSTKEASVLRLQLRGRRGGCLAEERERWAGQAWALRSLVAERLNAFCRAAEEGSEAAESCRGAGPRLELESCRLE